MDNPFDMRLVYGAPAFEERSRSSQVSELMDRIRQLEQTMSLASAEYHRARQERAYAIAEMARLLEEFK